MATRSENAQQSHVSQPVQSKLIRTLRADLPLEGCRKQKANLRALFLTTFLFLSSKRQRLCNCCLAESAVPNGDMTYIPQKYNRNVSSRIHVERWMRWANWLMDIVHEYKQAEIHARRIKWTVAKTLLLEMTTPGRKQWSPSCAQCESDKYII